jgi:hypothetical protein
VSQLPILCGKSSEWSKTKIRGRSATAESTGTITRSPETTTIRNEIRIFLFFACYYLSNVHPSEVVRLSEAPLSVHDREWMSIPRSMRNRWPFWKSTYRNRGGFPLPIESELSTEVSTFWGDCQGRQKVT